MHRYQILIEYVGTNFIGWQIQKKGNSVQGFVQSIISNILKEKITLIGSGRTDAGVHALEQSAHFDCSKKIINQDKFIKSINFFLNKKLVSITKLKKRNFNFKYLISKLNRSKYYVGFDLKGISNYAFPILLNTKSIKCRDKFEKHLLNSGIEFRRGNAGGGNQLRQPYLKKYKKLLYKNKFNNVEKVHFFGYYIGNYPYLKTQKLKQLIKILNNFI